MRNCPQCQRSNADDASFCSDCGHSLASKSQLLSNVPADALLPFAVGAQVALGRYVIEAVLGQGGMGTVYRARDVSLDRRCALKVLNSELTAHPTARKRMEREARALARIEHPNVVQVRNIFLEGELLVMELEYMDGGDLRSRVGPDGVDPAQAVAWMQGLLAGVQALHDAQLVHRDIKPENVLLSGQGVPKLTDLGVARDDAETGRTKTRLGAVLGTLEYMSPEQIQGLAVDARSDIYACGMVLYQLVTGALPFSAKSDFEWQEAHVRRPPAMGKLRVKAPELVPVVERAIAKEPEGRWQSAAEMGAGLMSLEPVSRPVADVGARVSTEPVRAAVEPVKNDPGAAGRRNVGVQWAWPVGALLLLGVGLAASTHGPPPEPTVPVTEVSTRDPPAEPVHVPQLENPAGITVIGSLTWQTETAPSQYNWKDAMAYCGDLTLGMLSDWRLPTKEELEGTIDKPGTKCPYIVAPLKATTDCAWYWSATPLQGSSSAAWGVYFGRVRCVR
jgi:tRNA A-37 threonylcarbamoyl transferase component Bud32